MPFEIVRNDITKMQVDAIVNAANSSLLGGGGVDGAIHRAAGAKLLAECMTLGGCKTGCAKITKGYKLPAKHVIHTVGPRWKDGDHGEKELLTSCYRNSLQLAKENGCESVAFPLISAGIYGYPRAEAIRVAADTITEFLTENDMTVYLVIFDTESFSISSKLYADINQFIDDNYAAAHDDRLSRSLDEPRMYNAVPAAAKPYIKPKVAADMFEAKAKKSKPAPQKRSFSEDMADMCAGAALPQTELYTVANAAASLEDALKQIDESFSQMLLRKIDEKGMTDAQCYKKANIDRRLFSKIRSDVNYRPAKQTALAFAIALELPLSEVKDMLMKAGYALSRSSKSDIIVEYFIQHGNYDIFEINEALFAFDQSLLGA